MGSKALLILIRLNCSLPQRPIYGIRVGKTSVVVPSPAAALDYQGSVNFKVAAGVEKKRRLRWRRRRPYVPLFTVRILEA